MGARAAKKLTGGQPRVMTTGMRPYAWLLLLCPSVAGAAAWPVNDREYGGRGADPIPMQASLLQLRSAEVHLTEVPVKDAWQVSATYEIHNPGYAAIDATLLLPEEGCAAGRACSAMAGAFQDLGVRFGDKLLAPAPAAAEAVRKWADPPGAGHALRLVAPPRQTTRLSVEYLLDRSRGAQHHGVQIVSSAGRWGGPVGTVRYVVELKQPTPYVLYPKTFKLESFAEQPAAQGPGSRTRLVFTAAGLSARSDFWAIFPEDVVAGKAEAGACPGFRGDLSDEELVPVLRDLNEAQRRACRDHVYALHGKPFKDPALRARYYGAAPALPAWAQVLGLALAPRPENRAFREGLLSPGEQAYLRALARPAPKK